MLKAICRSFDSLSIVAFSKLCAPHVRLGLEYGRPAIFACIITEMGGLERVQWYAKQLVDLFRGISCEGWLRLLKLHPVCYR